MHGQPVGGRDSLRVTGEGQFHALARGRGLGDEFGEVAQRGRGDGRTGNDGRGDQRSARLGERWARLGARSRTRARTPPPGVRSHTAQQPGVTVRFGGTGRQGRPQGPGGIGPERPENVAQVVERAGGRGPEQFEAVGETFRVVRHRAGPGPVAQHSGVQNEQAEPVGENVVHLAGDPGAFGGAGLFGPEFALPAERLDLGVQGPDQDPAAVQPQSEGEDGRLDQELGAGGTGPVGEGVGTDRTEPGEYDRGRERRAGAARRGQVVEAEQAGEGAVQQSAEQDGKRGGGNRVAAGQQQGQRGEDGSGHAQRAPGEVVDVPLGEAFLDGEHEDGQQEQRLGRAVPAGGAPTEQALLVVHAIMPPSVRRPGPMLRRTEGAPPLPIGHRHPRLSSGVRGILRPFRAGRTLSSVAVMTTHQFGRGPVSPTGTTENADTATARAGRRRAGGGDGWLFLSEALRTFRLTGAVAPSGADLVNALTVRRRVVRTGRSRCWRWGPGRAW